MSRLTRPTTLPLPSPVLRAKYAPSRPFPPLSPTKRIERRARGPLSINVRAARASSHATLGPSRRAIASPCRLDQPYRV